MFKLKLFENKIPRREFGPKKDENGEWGKLHNKEIYSLYRSHNTVRLVKSRMLTSEINILNKQYLNKIEILLIWNVKINLLENKISRRVLAPRRMRMESGESFTIRETIVSIFHIMEPG